MSDTPSLLVGMVWYRNAAEYDRLKAIYSDSDKMPDTYQDWLDTATNGYAKLAAQGLICNKVYLDPKKFRRWCKAKGREMDTSARAEYVTDYNAGRIK